MSAKDTVQLMKAVGAEVRNYRKLRALDDYALSDIVDYSIFTTMAHQESAMLRRFNEATEDFVVQGAMTQAQSIQNLPWFGGLWAESGHPVFELTPALAAALMLTEVPDIPVSEIRLPFPAIYVRVPANLLTLSSLRPGETERVPMHSFLVLEKQLLQSFDTTDVSFECNAAVQMQRAFGGDMVNAIRQKYSGQPRSRQWTINAFAGDVNIERILAMFSPSGDESFSEYSATLQRSFSEEKKDLERYATDEPDDCVLDAVMTMVFNLCLYLGAGIETTKYSRPVTGKHWKRTRYQKLGSIVKLPQQLIESASAYAHKGVVPAAWKLRTKHTVRGHWRNQACGPGMKLRKRIWVEPYWKGPDTAEEMERIYKAETLAESGRAH